MKYPRSYLFVPGNRPDRFAKAASSGAHEIVLDLEDAVGPDEKAAARQNAITWLAGGGRGIVRINGTDTHWFKDDLAALRTTPDAIVMVPKAEPESLSRAAEGLRERPLVALVESVAGLMGIHDVAAASGVSRIAFGNLDFGIDARIPGTGAVLDPARFQIALASRHADLPPPIDGVTVALDADGELRSDIVRARDLGFAAKLCIHPAQIDLVNEGFAPSGSEIAWARKILRAFEKSGGAVVRLDGKMVDRPMISRAKAILGDV